MDDLVSQKVLIKAIENIEARYGNDNSSLIEQGEVLDLITEVPTVDAVDVVRCKDCIHFREDGYCKVLMGYCGNEDWFCASGRRK